MRTMSIWALLQHLQVTRPTETTAESFHTLQRWEMRKDHINAYNDNLPKHPPSVDSPALWILHTRRWCSLSCSRFTFWQLLPTRSHVWLNKSFQRFHFTASQVPGQFTKHIYCSLSRAGLRMVFISLFSRSLEGRCVCFFFCKRKKTNVTNTEPTHFFPWCLLTPG